MSRKIVWTEKALSDFKSICSYWNNRNKSKLYSKKLLQLFNNTLDLIAFEPMIGLITDVEGIKLVRDFWIFYTESDHTIFVLQIKEQIRILKIISRN